MTDVAIRDKVSTIKGLLTCLRLVISNSDFSSYKNEPCSYLLDVVDNILVEIDELAAVDETD